MVMAVKGCFKLFLEEEVDPFQKIEGNQIKLQLKLQPKLCVKRGRQINSLKIYPSGIKNAKNAYFLVSSCAEQKDMIFMSLLKFSLNCLR